MPFQEGLEKLNIRPDTVQELGKAQEDAKQLMEQHHEVKKVLDGAEEKNKLLKSYAAGIDMSLRWPSRLRTRVKVASRALRLFRIIEIPLKSNESVEFCPEERGAEPLG